MALAAEAADKDSQNIPGSTDASGQITHGVTARRRLPLEFIATLL